MDKSYDKACVSAIVGIALTALYEAAERAYESELRKVSTELFERYCDLSDFRRSLLELPKDSPAAKEQANLPF